MEDGGLLGGTHTRRGCSLGSRAHVRRETRDERREIRGEKRTHGMLLIIRLHLGSGGVGGGVFESVWDVCSAGLSDSRGIHMGMFARSVYV